MPKDTAIKKVLVIGSGPIVIGQAAEFDYAGTQACKALKEEGIQVVLVNSNPATIMTDDNIADQVYIQPITIEALDYIIDKERPDGILPTLGGQTGLNMAVELKEAGILEKYNVTLLGTSLETIKKAEDRESFRNLMIEIGEPIPQSKIIEDIEDGVAFSKVIGFPIIIRPAYTMGGLGGGIAHNEKELREFLHTGLMHSRIHQVLVERSVAGWKEIEYEVMRDANDTCIIICNMENMDPVGIHTGDSIVVAPSQTLTDNEYHMLRSSAVKIIKALEIEGGCNVQYALNPESKEYIVIEVNPRVSRSSALASKAAGYPIAKIAAKIAIGLHLHEIDNAVTKKTKASFEPALDYVVTKIPKWPFDKFDYANRTLGTAMKATGEVMAIDRTFESSLLKAVISLEGKETGLRKEHLEKLSKEQLLKMLSTVDDERIFVLAEAFRKEITIDTIHQKTGIDKWFLRKINHIIEVERKLENELLTKELLIEAESLGFTDIEIQALSCQTYEMVDTIRRAHGIYPVYKMVDTCAAEFESHTPYYYSSYEDEDENLITKEEKIMVIGSGPIRIGQGIEFDYCSVHAVWAIKELGYESIIVNNNPETVSTDFDISDKLYFEPLFIEDVLNIVRKERPKGVIVQFGGQTAINLAPKLVKKGVQVLGTSVDSIDVAEDRNRFDKLLAQLEIPRPKGGSISSIEEALTVANDIGYPVLIRPSYVIGGRAMMVVRNDEDLIQYLEEAASISTDYQVLIDEYIEGTEVEVDAISDGEDILIPGIMEHIERTGVHSGDSFCVYPPQNLTEAVMNQIMDYTHKIAKALEVIGLMNIQFVARDEKVYIIEVNPRASRTVPILSKVTKIPMVKLAMEVILGDKLNTLGYGTGLASAGSLIAVKAPVFSFIKLSDVDVALTPEMKSTGEVLGIDNNYDRALYKAFIGAGYTFSQGGQVLVSIQEESKNESLTNIRKLIDHGYSVLATSGTHEYLSKEGIKSSLMDVSIEEVKEMMKSREINMIFNIPTKGKDVDRVGFKLRTYAQHIGIPCFTCMDTLSEYLRALAYKKKEQPISYETINYYMKK